MKMKSLRLDGPHQLTILALLVIALILLIPGGKVLADSNAPTITNTPEPTDTPAPEPPTQEPEVAPTSTPIPIVPTDVDENAGAMLIVTPPPGNANGLSTINRILLMILAIVVVIIIGVIVYIFINQTRGGLGER